MNIKETKVCKSCNQEYVDYTYRRQYFCSRKCMGKGFLGRTFPEWICRKITLSKLKGKEPIESKRIRKTARFMKCRKKVLERDCFTCQVCFESGIDIHHIDPIRNNLNLAYDINNMVVVCKKCHDLKITRHEKEWEQYFLKVLKDRRFISG